jgi:hypothetical protein
MGEAIFETQPLYSWGKGPRIPVRHKNWSPLFEEEHLVRVRGGVTPLILNLSCRRMGEAIFETQPLYSWGKGPRIPVRHKNWSPLFEEKYVFLLPEI